MSVVYAPPRAILSIFDPADFPDSFVSASSSTSNYNTALATLATIKTNLIALQTKLANVGQFPYSQNVSTTPVAYSATPGNFTTAIANLYPPGLSANPFAIWASCTMQYNNSIPSTGPVPTTFSNALINFSGGKTPNNIEIFPNAYLLSGSSYSSAIYYSNYNYIDLPFNTTATLYSYLFTITMNPTGYTAGTNAITASNPIINTNANIYFICIK